MLFLGRQDGDEQLAADIVANFFAVRDRGFQVRVRGLFELQVATDNFVWRLAD